MRLSCIFILFSCVSYFAQATQYKQIDWQNLQPDFNQQVVDLPEVNDLQKGLLQGIILLQKQATMESLMQAKELKALLAEQGIDADKALAAREQYMRIQQQNAQAITNEYDSQKVRVAGFIVPIAFDGTKGTEFLLVPQAGACIHLPPPPANQIVRVSYPEGFEFKSIQYPVWVEGTFKSNLHTDNVYLVDGYAELTMGYEMSASLIIDYYGI